MSIPIIDSHIHLFPESHLNTLAWYSSSSPLGSQHSVSEYRQATRSVSVSEIPSRADSTYLRGFVFVETDRISSVSPPHWDHALDEVSFLTRIISGEPIEGEGHESADRELCFAIVPWAPVPTGPQGLQEYLEKVRERTGSEGIWKKVQGVRYLVQDKPAGTMLQDGFVEGLRYLGELGLSFDLGVDARQGGIWQLDEAVQLLNRVFTNERGVVDLSKRGPKLVINHLCKPNLRTVNGPAVSSNPDYISWAERITWLAAFPTTYMKLSGLFSETPPLPPFSPDEEEETNLITSIVNDIEPWTDVIFDRFGPHRIMFGSDWPVCNVGGGGNKVTWNRWRKVVEIVLERRQLNEAHRREIWGGVAGRVYGDLTEIPEGCCG